MHIITESSVAKLKKDNGFKSHKSDPQNLWFLEIFVLLDKSERLHLKKIPSILYYLLFFGSDVIGVFPKCFTEFSDKNIYHYNERAQTCHLLCERPACYHNTSKT